ncbi:MAG: hypothetical protein ACJ74H_10420 [Thermoanaerobaculia bacterium]
MTRVVAALLFCTLLASDLLAASKREKPKPGTDEFAIESTVIAVYNVISGPAGRRDWNRFKELFAPGAHLATYGKDGIAVMTPEEYIERNKPYFDEHGFFEWPVETRVDRFKDIAHVTSRYESRHAPTDKQPFARGVNHLELVRSGDRWVVYSLVWQGE